MVLTLPKISSIQFLLDVSLGLSSPLYMLKQLSHTLYLSFTNESVSLPRRVSRNSQEPLPPQESHAIPSTARPLQAYFIVNNRIYQSPDMYTVLSNRLARTTVSNPVFFPNANGWPVTCTADVALFSGIVAGRPAQVQARLHPALRVRVAHRGDDGAGEDRRGEQKADGRPYRHWHRGGSGGVVVPPRRGPRAGQKTREGKVPHEPQEAAKHDAPAQCDADHGGPLVSDVSREGGCCCCRCRCRRHGGCSLRGCGGVGGAAKFCDSGSSTDHLAIRRVSVVRPIRIARLHQRYDRRRQTKEEAYVFFKYRYPLVEQMGRGVSCHTGTTLTLSRNKDTQCSCSPGFTHAHARFTTFE